MIRSRISRGLALGTGALATGALVLASAPAATAAEDTAPGYRGGPIDRPYFGARIAVTADGATVIHVVEGGPADDAGLEAGDAVISIDGVTLDHRGSLREALQGTEAGDQFAVVYTHDGAEATTTVTVAPAEDRPDRPAAEDVPWVGAHLVRVEGVDGTLVRAVQADSPADDAGLEAGDVVTAIDGQEITDWWEAREILRDHAPGDTVSVTVERDDAKVVLSLTLGSVDEAGVRPGGGGARGLERLGVRDGA